MNDSRRAKPERVQVLNHRIQSCRQSRYSVSCWPNPGDVRADLGRCVACGFGVAELSFIAVRGVSVVVPDADRRASAGAPRGQQSADLLDDASRSGTGRPNHQDSSGSGREAVSKNLVHESLSSSSFAAFRSSARVTDRGRISIELLHHRLGHVAAYSMR